MRQFLHANFVYFFWGGGAGAVGLPSELCILIVRPWYVRTTFPYHKDVVIMIDDANQMRRRTLDGKTYQSIAVEGALTVLETLNSQDRVRDRLNSAYSIHTYITSLLSSIQV